MKLLVYGATCSQGRPVAEKLLAAGHEVRPLTRDPAKVQGMDGAEVVRDDMANPDSLEAATQGREGVFLHIPFFARARSTALPTRATYLLLRWRRVSDCSSGTRAGRFRP